MVPEKVRQLNDRVSPIVDIEIEDYLKKKLNLRATLDKADAIRGASLSLLLRRPITTLKPIILIPHRFESVILR